jgi:hypothetical protein
MMMRKGSQWNGSKTALSHTSFLIDYHRKEQKAHRKDAQDRRQDRKSGIANMSETIK